MSILIVAEHDNNSLAPNFANAVAAAKQIGEGEIAALILGENCDAPAESAAQMDGVSRVLMADAAPFGRHLAENCAPPIAEMSADYSHVMMSSGAFARNILPRAAALADSQMITDVIRVESADTFVRPIYAGNAWATVQSKDKVKFLTARATAFEPVGRRENSSAAIETLEISAMDSGLSEFIEARLSKSERPELTTARAIISGGRGLGGVENFELLARVADKLNAAVGASRAAVDAGYAPNDWQVGQTGKIVAPDLYIAVGISGAIQHVAGMKDAKVIVAINKDGDAPIFEIADYGLVGDLNEILPQLEKALS